MTNTETPQPTHYYSTSGYSMIDHQLDPLIEVAWTWLNDYASNDEDRQDSADAMAETLEAAAAYLRAGGQRCEPLEIECDECGARAGQPCCTTEEEATALISQMSDADLIDFRGGAHELRSWCDVPTLAQMRSDLEQERTYLDRTPHPERVETAAHLFKHELPTF